MEDKEVTSKGYARLYRLAREGKARDSFSEIVRKLDALVEASYDPLVALQLLEDYERTETVPVAGVYTV